MHFFLASKISVKMSIAILIPTLWTLKAFFKILGFLKFHSDVPYYGSLCIHCSGNFPGPFNMETYVLQFWEIFLYDFIDNFLHSVFSSSFLDLLFGCCTFWTEPLFSYLFSSVFHLFDFCFTFQKFF